MAILRPFLCSKDALIVLDNVESILDPQGMDAQDIYAVVKELSELSNICLCITSRVSAIPSDFETLGIPTLSTEAARDTFYRIYKNGERTNLIDSILDQLDCYPQSITLLAIVAHHNKWDTNRLVREAQQTSVLHTEHNRSLTTTTELSLISSMSQEPGPDTRALLGVIAFFPRGVVHAPTNPPPDTQATLNFPRPLATLSHVPHGFRALDIDNSSNIRAKSTAKVLTKHWAEYHIATWGDTTLYSGVDDVFALAPNNFLTGEHTRNLWVDPTDPASVRVNFERPFAAPPKVVIFLNYIDLDKRRNWRLKTTATDIDVNGFTLGIETWGNTILYTAKACWIAYPEDHKHIFSTSANTMDVRPWNLPRLRQSKSIEFSGVEFWKTPSVFVALNFFDIDCRTNFRIDAHVDNVTKTGLVWHIDSWSDTILYSAKASIIAFN